MFRVSVRDIAAHQTKLVQQKDQSCAQKCSKVPHFANTASESNSHNKFVLRNSINPVGPFFIILRNETTRVRRLSPKFLNRTDMIFICVLLKIKPFKITKCKPHQHFFCILKNFNYNDAEEILSNVCFHTEDFFKRQKFY